MHSPTIPVTKEGVPFIGFVALAAIVFALLEWSVLAAAALAAGAFVIYFFRDPERVVPSEPGAVVSPADGKVIEIREDFEGSLQGQEVRRISIFMNIFDVHVNRAPITGKVEQIQYQPGCFFPADRAGASVRNERNALLLRSEGGESCTVVQVAGFIARRIVCWAEVGDTVHRGERFGLIRFGSRLDVYMPREYSVLVKVGQRVVAGQSVLARRPAEPAA